MECCFSPVTLRVDWSEDVEYYLVKSCHSQSEINLEIIL